MKKLNDQNTERVKKLIAEKLAVSTDDIAETDKLKEDLGVDSIDEIEIVMEIEKEFNIAIPDHEIDEIITVDDLCHKVALYL